MKRNEAYEELLETGLAPIQINYLMLEWRWMQAAKQVQPLYDLSVKEQKPVGHDAVRALEQEVCAELGIETEYTMYIQTRELLVDWWLHSLIKLMKHALLKNDVIIGWEDLLDRTNPDRRLRMNELVNYALGRK